MGNKFLDLTNAVLLGRGSERDCYLHPYKKGLCVKVHARDGQGRHKPQQLRDRFYYSFLLKNKEPWDFVARYFGTIKTNKGKGLVFEVPRDSDGSLSKSLAYYVRAQSLSRGYVEELLNQLYRQIYDEAIFVYDLSPSNLFLKRDVDGETLVIVDGLGKRQLLRLLARSKFFARLQLRKSWRRLHKKFLSREKMFQ